MAPRFVEMPGSALERGVEFFASSLPAWGVTDTVSLLQQRARHLLAVDGAAEGEGEGEGEGDVPEVCQPHGDDGDGPERNACSASSPPRWFSYSRSPPPLRRERGGGGGGGGEEAVEQEAEEAEGAEEGGEGEAAKGHRQKQSLTRTANAMLAAGAFMGAVYGVVLRRRATQMHKDTRWTHGERPSLKSD